MLITVSISIVFYVRTMTVLEKQQERFEQRFNKEFLRRWPRETRAPHPFPEDLDEARNDIITQLVIINGSILLIVAGAGYVLSGQTLKPIAKTHAEQKRFVSDAAHELKTPIAALKTSLEVNLMDRKLNRHAKNILRENLEDVTSLQQLTERLLKLARTNGNTVALHPTNISAVIKKF